MNRLLRTTGIALAGLLVTLAVGGCERQWCSKWHDTEYIMKKIDSEVKQLDLTSEQQVKYQEIRSRLEKDVCTHMGSMDANIDFFDAQETVAGMTLGYSF